MSEKSFRKNFLRKFLFSNFYPTFFCIASGAKLGFASVSVFNFLKNVSYSIDLKGQSEKSWLCSDRNSLVYFQVLFKFLY